MEHTDANSDVCFAIIKYIAWLHFLKLFPILHKVFDLHII